MFCANLTMPAESVKINKFCKSSCRYNKEHTDTVSAELFALLAAVAIAGHDVLAKKGLFHCRPLYGAVVCSTVISIIFWTITIAGVHFNTSPWRAVFWLVLAGMASPGIAVPFIYKAFEQIGPSKAIAISSTHPMFSTFLAIIFLGEKPGLQIYVGSIIIITGVFFLTVKNGFSTRQLNELVYPLLTAFALGFTFIFRKLGISYFPSPVFATAVCGTSALFFIFLISRFYPPHKRFAPTKKATTIFIIAGLFQSTAYYLFFKAMQIGNVSLVAPLINTEPLFVIIMSYLLLKGVEKITPRIILGAIFIVVGAMIITTFR